MPPAALRVSNLKKSYKDVVAVNGLELEVFPGECFGLLGPNGAGKTTTIEICEGLTDPDSGTVEVLGLQWAHFVGATPDGRLAVYRGVPIALTDDVVREHLQV